MRISSGQPKPCIEAHVVYRKALDEGIDKYLVGRPVKPVDRRYN